MFIRPVMVAFLLMSCSDMTNSVFAKELPQSTTPSLLVDKNATQETRALFVALKKLARDKILFGHQHTTCYGIGWKDDDERSDVKDVTGSFPAVYGWDMGHVGSDHGAKLIVDAYERGGINTISWHMKNPVTGKGTKDTSRNVVKDLLPGGIHNDKLKRELDGFVRFAGSLRDRNGIPVPVVFRPWHEHTGGWFWWGSKSCTPDEFVKLWRYTVTYLRDIKGVHHLLWAYSPSQSGINSVHDYEANRFPGYNYVDVLGIDSYTTDDTDQLIKLCRVVVELANKQGKVPALTEFGWRQGLNNCQRNDWYTQCFLKPLKEDSLARGIAWALTWRNGSKDHFWVPYPGHAAVDDFKAFYSDPITVFENELPNMYSK